MKNRNKLLIIISIIFIVIAVSLLILGFILSGNDIIKWLKSSYAIICYIVVGVYVLILAYVFIGDKIKKL